MEKIFIGILLVPILTYSQIEISDTSSSKRKIQAVKYDESLVKSGWEGVKEEIAKELVGKTVTLIDVSYSDLKKQDGSRITYNEEKNFQNKTFEIIGYSKDIYDNYTIKNDEGVFIWRVRSARDLKKQFIIEIEIEEEPEPFEEQIFDVVEEQPEFVGGLSELYGYLNRNIQYPEIAKENGIQGKVFVQFVVWKDGTIRNVKVIKGLNSQGQEVQNPLALEKTKEDLKKIIFEIKRLENYKKNLFSIRFNKKRKTQKRITQLKSQQAIKERSLSYLESNLKNENFKLLENEAIRVIKAMPKWTPGKQRGKAVNARFTIPIKFRIS